MKYSGSGTPVKPNAPGAFSRALQRRRGVIIALALWVIVGSGLWQFFNRDRPQRIVALPSSNSQYIVRDGMIYRLEWDEKRLTAIIAMPASGWDTGISDTRWRDPCLGRWGVPKDRIIVAFQHPARRKYGEYAAA